MKKNGAIVEKGLYVCKEETHLTVQKTSLFFSGDGFSAYDPKGELVFRVDSYDETAEFVLMDVAGKCILTVRRKWPSMHQRWEGFIGEKMDGQKPLFSVRRTSMIERSCMTVEVYTDPIDEYHTEGSFACRNCNIFNSDNELVAEIRRKVDCSTSVVLGNDVFLLCLKAGFDGAFAMGLVLVLDQITADDDYNGEDDADGVFGGRKICSVHPTVEYSNMSL